MIAMMAVKTERVLNKMIIEDENIKDTTVNILQNLENLKYPYSKKGMTSRVIDARRFLFAKVECTLANPGKDANQSMKYCPNPMKRKIKAEIVMTLMIESIVILFILIYIYNTM
jgi:hypothetical protein